jgi:hypothetical protein
MKMFSHKTEIVGLCVCMFAYSSRTETPICTIGIIPWDQEEILERSKIRKFVQGSSTGEYGSCSSETMHDRRTAPRSKLFRRGDHRNRGHNHEKSILGSSPGESAFVAWKQHDRRMEPKKRLFRRGDYRSNGHKPKTVPGFESCWRFSV